MTTKIQAQPRRARVVRKETASDRIFLAFCYVLVGLFALICLLPMWTSLMASLTNEGVLMREGYGLWVPQLDFSAYRMIFTGTTSVLRAYGVTIFITVVGTTLTVVFTALTAYPLALNVLRFRRPLYLFIYFTSLFNGGLVANYILITQFLKLGNTIWVLIIPGCLSSYNFFLMCNYFKTLPASVIESARIDGANEVRIFAQIVLPISKPILATITLFAGMGYWNEWQKALLYIDDTALYPLQYIIMKLQNQVNFLTSSFGAQALAALGDVTLPTVGIRMATAMVTIGPIVLLYPFLQKYFIKGVVIGAVKE